MSRFERGSLLQSLRAGASNRRRQTNQTFAAERHRKPRHQSDELPLSHRIAAVARWRQGRVPPSGRTARLGGRVLSAPVWGTTTPDDGRPLRRRLGGRWPVTPRPMKCPVRQPYIYMGHPLVRELPIGYAAAPASYRTLSRLTAASAPAGPPVLAGPLRQRRTRVAGTVTRPGSHRTVRTLFVYGSSGRRVAIPAAGRFATSKSSP